MSQGINIQQTSSIDNSNASYYFSNKDYAISNPIRSSSQNFKIEPNRTMAGKALDSQSGTYNFIIKKSQYNLIDLKDCMFVVSGTLVDKSQSSSSKYRLGCGWLLSLIDDAKLTIDNCVVSQNRNPALYSDIDAVLNHTYEELTNGSLAMYGNQINKIEKKKLIISYLTDTGFASNTDNIAAATHYDGNTDIRITITNTATVISPTLEPNQIYKIKITDDMVADAFKGNQKFDYSNAYLIIKTNSNGVATAVLKGVKRTQDGSGQINGGTNFLKAQRLTLVSEFYDKTMNLNGVLDDMDEVPASDDNGTAGCRFSVAIKLEDLFSEVKSMAPIFNRDVTITLTRAPHSNIVCNNGSIDTTEAQVSLGYLDQWFLSCTNYQLSNEAINQMLNYYGSPVETLITTRDVVAVSIAGDPTGGSSQFYRAAVQLKYRNTALIISFPRTTVFTNQVNNLYGQLNKARFLRDDHLPMFDEWQRLANCSINPCLKQIEITDSAGKTLKKYDFLKCGRISSNNCNPIQYASNYKHDGVGNNKNVVVNSYMEAYLDFCKICEQFGLLPSDVIDYDTWITEHFCLAVDLSPYELTPGSDINMNITYESWDAESNYNPFYLNGNSATNKYLTNQILLQWYGSKALSIGAGEVMLKNVLTKAPETIEVEQTN